MTELIIGAAIVLGGALAIFGFFWLAVAIGKHLYFPAIACVLVGASGMIGSLAMHGGNSGPPLWPLIVAGVGLLFMVMGLISEED
jgi:hypothetical protein